MNIDEALQGLEYLANNKALHDTITLPKRTIDAYAHRSFKQQRKVYQTKRIRRENDRRRTLKSKRYIKYQKGEDRRKMESWLVLVRLLLIEAYENDVFSWDKEETLWQIITLSGVKENTREWAKNNDNYTMKQICKR